MKLYKITNLASYDITTAHTLKGDEIFDFEPGQGGGGIDLQDDTQVENSFPVIIESQSDAVACSFWRNNRCALYEPASHVSCGGVIASCDSDGFFGYTKDATPNYYKWGLFVLQNNLLNPANVYDVEIGISNINQSDGSIKYGLMISDGTSGLFEPGYPDIRNGQNIGMSWWLQRVDKNNYYQIDGTSYPNTVTSLKNKLTVFPNQSYLNIGIFAGPHPSLTAWPDSFSPPTEDATWNPPTDNEYYEWEPSGQPNHLQCKLYVRYKHY